jgi:hypothetical protein
MGLARSLPWKGGGELPRSAIKHEFSAAKLTAHAPQRQGEYVPNPPLELPYPSAAFRIGVTS